MNGAIAIGAVDGDATPYASLQISEQLGVSQRSRDTRFKPGNQEGRKRRFATARLDHPVKIRRALWTVVADLRRGKMRADVANAAINGMRLLLEIHRTFEQEGRIAELEAELTGMRRRVAELLGCR